jgi:hypothetical protein
MASNNYLTYFQFCGPGTPTWGQLATHQPYLTADVIVRKSIMLR